MQSPQAVWLSEPVYFPAAQRVQVSCFGAEPNEPGRHGDGAAEPTEHEVPAGHVSHWFTLDIEPTKFAGFAVPPGQGNAAAAPRAQ